MKEEVTFQNDQSSWVSWGASLVKKSATWSWNKMWGALAEVDKEVIKYIVSEICKVYLKILFSLGLENYLLLT